MRSRRLRRGTALIAGTSVIFMPTLAGAHTAADWYPLEWGAVYNQAVQLVWGSTAFLPGGSAETARNRIKDGAFEWNGLESPFAYVAPGTFNPTASLDDPCANAPNYNFISWASYVGGTSVARTATCPGPNGTSIIGYVMQFSSDHAFYTGTGSTPSDKFDTWRISAHEHGHGAGFEGHWPGSLCSGSTAETLCASTSPGLDSQRFRTLQQHDEHTFEGAY